MFNRWCAGLAAALAGAACATGTTDALNATRSVLDELAELLVEQETVDAEQLQELLINRDVTVASYV